MNIGKTLVQIERMRRKLMAVDPEDTETLLAISQKLDGLVVQYYREKLLHAKWTARVGPTHR
ncbi:MAG: aspartyl-phosphate phosphatase Spo0E family protein [Thermanaeromonas sp.]|uniref:aspartyl-phosphate phosphatase Spo0E family protein n=1 Tax=Thermanaeromonas sp. TaxID=2003697 RepID=UPI00243BF449|nr:aspartyl-phosphate phosphatase Spo0E family protein [Thermanaeromonas sp.]MCG0279054.1 aspartyl-phosphate phosphatase Spo0E family protein [Thermanaeromonas sp.]